jgi:hypothetical protein
MELTACIEVRNTYKILVTKPERKRPLARPSRRVYNTTANLTGNQEELYGK